MLWRTSKKTSKLRVAHLCEENPPGTSGFPSQRASNAENISIWWHHHVWVISQAIAQPSITRINLKMKLTPVSHTLRHLIIMYRCVNALCHLTSWTFSTSSWPHSKLLMDVIDTGMRKGDLLFTLIKSLPSNACGYTLVVISLHAIHYMAGGELGPLLLTWINFDPNMDKLLHPL